MTWRVPGCRKAKRECIYPEPNPSRSQGRESKGKAFLPDSGSSSSEEEDEAGTGEKLSAIPDDDDEWEGVGDPEPLSAVSAPAQGHDSMSPPQKGKTSTTADEDTNRLQRSPKRPQSGTDAVFGSKRYASLPKDARFFLKHHFDTITHHHYAVKYDGNNFFRTTFLEIALGYEPLLYAIVAYSSYFHQLSSPNGKIQVFLSYYNKSVTLLRQSLEKSTKHSVATLLTILQLASFEVRSRL